MTRQDRFDALYIPEPMSGCWIWLGALTIGGYASFSIATSTAEVAHRYSYKQKYGPIPQGKELDHLCRVRCCVNPDHVEPVTRKENVRRGLGGPKSVCKYGHPFNEANTYWKANGAKSCRVCDKRRQQQYRDARKLTHA
jgi:hypothetical protein